MKGEVVQLYVYNLGGEVDLERLRPLLGLDPSFEVLDLQKSAPKYVELPRPLALKFPPQKVETTVGTVTLESSARIYSIGAVGLTLRIPFEVPSLCDLYEWGNLRILRGSEEIRLRAIADELKEEIATRAAPALVEPYLVSVEPERYTTYVITEGVDARELLEKRRREVAGLVANEPDSARLSPEEVEDNLRYWFNYYEGDLVVVDWDYALVVEPSGKYEDTLYVFELANLELLELRVYDAFLDSVLSKAYLDLSRIYEKGWRSIFHSARDVVEELAAARVDLLRVSDEVNNIGKFFGDWYLAKLHVGLTERFHIGEWEATVHEKMLALNDLYALAQHEVEHRRGLALEMAIVVLFLVDLLLLVWVFR